MSTVATPGAAAVPRHLHAGASSPAASDGRSNYSRILGQRLLDLAERLMRKPGDPDLRKALNDALHEATRNPQAIVSGEALVKARQALEHSKAHGPVSHRGSALQRQLDPTGARTPYSQSVQARLQQATRDYLAAPSQANRQRLNAALHEARHSRDAVVSLDALTRADRALGAQPVRAAVTQQVDIRSAPGGDALPGSYVGVETRDSAGRKVLTQARLRAQLAMDDSGQWRVARIEAVGPQVSADGKPVSRSQKVYVVRDAQGQPITDPAQAADRVRELLRHGAMTAPAPVAQRPPVPRATGAPGQAAAPQASAEHGLQPIIALKIDGLGFKQIEDFVLAHGGAKALPKIKEALRGNHVGVLAFLPLSNAFFLGTSQATVPINGVPLKPTLVISTAGKVSAGLGNFYPITVPAKTAAQGAGNAAAPAKRVMPGKALHLWFWNVLSTSSAMVDGIAKSLRTPGVEVSLGTASLGVAALPACADKSVRPGLGTTVGVGASLRVRLVVRDGQPYLKSGHLMLPIAIGQAVVNAVGEALSNWNRFTCTRDKLVTTAKQTTDQVVDDLSKTMDPGEVAKYAAAIGALALTLLQNATGGLAPQM